MFSLYSLEILNEQLKLYLLHSTLLNSPPPPPYGQHDRKFLVFVFDGIPCIYGAWKRKELL